MNFKELFKMQVELDENINKNHGTSYETTFNKRIMAFLVEIGEFANETRCFKYWSNKPSSEKCIILEEYVDGIHFILSLGIALKIDFNYNFEPLIISNSFTNAFLDVYHKGSLLYKDYNQNNSSIINTYIELFNLYLGLGRFCDFSFEDIYQGYLKKNQINYDRQLNNY